LYGAWLKAHHPLEFYETYINIMEEKGDKDKIIAAREEASEYFNIVFEPLRFGQDNRSIHASPNGTMINTLGSIKGYGVTIGRTLYDCSKKGYDSFVDVLDYLDKRGIKEAKFRPLILIDYFCQFGNQRELIEIAKMWDFFKQGTAKSIKKDLVKDEYLKAIVERYSTGKTKTGKDAASYTFASPDDTYKCIKECEKFIKQANIDEIGMRVRIQNYIDILGYCDIRTGKEEDRRRLIATDVTPVKSQNGGDVWAYRVSTKSLGSGKAARLTVRINDYNNCPINKGDILYATDVFLNNKGYWYLSKYRIEA
jgi:DNA polymerase III alpha subunit